MRKLLFKTLTPENYECILAHNAALGLQACRKEKPDLIILDVNLPDGNGIELCRKIKDDMAIRHIPILIMTGEAVQVENRTAGLEAGADDYILKPFDSAELLLRLKNLIRASSKPTHS
ncbi:MAG: response regulator transcription factor [Elusimicrobia bacterium]|nr:response regulator transcription factor [Elusimicrobiota bacterium]